MTVTVRTAAERDVATCGRICYEAFRNIAERHAFPPDMPSPEAGVELVGALVAHPAIHGLVAEIDGRVVGSNFLWELSPIAGVGPITIDPSVQNGGAGRALMEGVLARAHERRAPGVRLVKAAYHARSLSLYAKLGFDVREPLAAVQGTPPGSRVPGCDVRAATGADLDACEALHRAIHGFERTGELRDAVAQGTAQVVLRGGALTGYTTGVGFFGYSVARTDEDLQALIAAAPSYPGPGFLVPMRNTALLRWCLGNGLRVVQPMTLMSVGLYNEPRGAFLPSVIY